ncbi:uncharacterized protein LOC143330478 isoform X2 [Chaetodon auriga]|uniref:uncharacterized protein LOC143330478 isoform X2 n=1 Tax=Chaetodon auriga TaxID=39042 RepID=UPI004032ED56
MNVSDVERRSRSLRTQYGRVLWHPERVSTVQQKMLREKLDFLRPYIVRRRGDSYLEEKFDDQEEDDEELETEGSLDQEMGSSFGSPLDADVTGQDLDDEPQSASTPNPAPLHCPNPQLQVTDVMSLSCPHHHKDEGSTNQPEQTASTPQLDVLNHFAEVMLADMRQIKNPVVLMRLRRDITDLVFKAVEEDVQRRCVQVPSVPKAGESAQLRSCSRPQQASSQTNYSWRQRFMMRKSKGCEIGRRMQRWEEMKHMRRRSRSRLSLPNQQGQAQEGMSDSSSQVIIQASEIKRETEPHMVKVEEDTLPLA